MIADTDKECVNKGHKWKSTPSVLKHSLDVLLGSDKPRTAGKPPTISHTGNSSFTTAWITTTDSCAPVTELQHHVYINITGHLITNYNTVTKFELHVCFKMANEI